MALIMGQTAIPVSGSGSVLVCHVPPAAISVQICAPLPSAFVWFGTSSSVSATNGIGVNANDMSVMMDMPVTAGGFDIWAINNNAVTPTIAGYIITTTT